MFNYRSLHWAVDGLSLLGVRSYVDTEMTNVWVRDTHKSSTQMLILSHMTCNITNVNITQYFSWFLRPCNELVKEMTKKLNT